jgi:hypothetical protein
MASWFNQLTLSATTLSVCSCEILAPHAEGFRSVGRDQSSPPLTAAHFLYGGMVLS